MMAMAEMLKSYNQPQQQQQALASQQQESQVDSYLRTIGLDRQQQQDQRNHDYQLQALAQQERLAQAANMQEDARQREAITARNFQTQATLENNKKQEATSLADRLFTMGKQDEGMRVLASAGIAGVGEILAEETAMKQNVARRNAELALPAGYKDPSQMPAIWNDLNQDPISMQVMSGAGEGAVDYAKIRDMVYPPSAATGTPDNAPMGLKVRNALGDAVWNAPGKAWNATQAPLLDFWSSFLTGESLDSKVELTTPWADGLNIQQTLEDTRNMTPTPSNNNRRRR